MRDMRLEIPATGVKSICWVGETLVDWASGGVAWGLDGSQADATIEQPVPFDASTVSPSGRYAVLYQRFGTRGAVLDRGHLLRELTRDDYHARDYPYPVALFCLPDGREVIAHCPDNWDELHIEELASGERLTRRSAERRFGFFHSQLEASPKGDWLISPGWVWSPRENLMAFPISKVLADPEILDRDERIMRDGRVLDVTSATFLADDRVVTADSLRWWVDEPQSSMRSGDIYMGIYDLASGVWESWVPLEEDAGLLMAMGPEHVVGFFQYPRLFDVRTGRVVHRWPDLLTGDYVSSIYWYPPLPPLALDAKNRRFAVADAERITIVTCDDPSLV